MYIFNGFALIITTMHLKQQFWHSYHILLNHKLRPIHNNRNRQEKRGIEYIHLFMYSSNDYKQKRMFPEKGKWSKINMSDKYSKVF